MDALVALLGRNGFLPHGYCFTWTPGLLWSMVTADVVVAAAYFSIPVATLSFVRRRPDPTLNLVAGLFSAFIFACGLTHVMDVVTVWQPYYGLQALIKIVTAALSLATAIALWPLIPRALKIPSVKALQEVIASLEAAVRQRRSAEELLRATQQSLAVTLASIDAGFIATDRAGRITHMNAVAQRIFGWAEAQALGRGLFEVYRSESLPAAAQERNPVDLMLEQRITVDSARHVVAIARDDRRTPLELKAAVTYGDDGAITGLAMVFRDMTAVLRAEAASSRLAAIVESANDAIIGKTLAGTITSWNEAAERMFGYSAEQAIGRQIGMLVPAELQADEAHILARLAQGERIPAFDTVRLTQAGERIEVSIAISPIRDGQGRIVGASKSARDISVQRRAEAALRDSQERLRFALQSARIGTWDLDLATGAAQTSVEHDRCFGYTEPQQDWSAGRFIAQVHADERDEVERTMRLAIDERHGWDVQCRVVWPDASVHWISAHGSFQQGPRGASRMFGIVSEITQQKQAEAARMRAERLEAENRQILVASRLKNQFLANMSHELRTPLNAIIGFADLLHSGYIKPESPKHRDFLGHIGTSGRHLLQLINDVLDLSKVESGKFEFFPEPVNLPVLMKEMLDILHAGIHAKRIQIAVEIDPTLTDLVLDPLRLKQVLYNYLSNAIKFSAAGGRVTLRAAAQGEAQFRLEVEDNGIGIAAADLPRLFTEFQQLDDSYSKQHQGTGLGLALTRRLVQAQGGRVGVRSTPGQGSVFFAVLDRQVPAGPAREDSAAAGERVLVIEDDQRMQSRLVEVFAKAGYGVDAASGGAQALDQARHTAYAALTLGLQLRDRRGLDLLARIRNDGASHASPVVGVSMAADEETSAVFAVANVLCKPIRSDEILASMAQFRRPSADGPNVIVIDDDEHHLDLMRATLKSIGIDSLCFQDGREALREIERRPPDAIVLDLMMPGFDGFQVLAALQELPAARRVPVFIWTAMVLSDADYAALAGSAHAVLRKGVDSVADLPEGVRRWRAGAALETEAAKG